MRIRDLRWYILAGIILLLAYLGLALGFYLSIRSQAVSSVVQLTDDALNNDVLILDSTIKNYYEQFCDGNSVLNTDFNKTGIANKFNDERILIVEGKEFLNSSDNNLYVLFYNPNALSEELIGGYLPISQILDFSSRSNVVFNSSGGIKYSNLGTTNIGTMMNLLQDENFLSKYDGTKSFSHVYNINGVDGVLSVKKILDYNYGVFIPLESAYFSINWVSSQALCFYIVGVSIIIAIIVLIVFAVKKASVLLRVDRHSISNANSIVIRTDKKGKIIFVNVAFKRLFKMKKIDTISDFIEVNSKKSIIDFLKDKKTITCYYEFEDKTIYFQFTPVGVVSTYYLVGCDITLEYLRIKSLEELNGKNEITGCDNYFALNNMYPIITSQTNSDVSFVEFTIQKYLDIISLFGNDNYNILLKELLSILKVQFDKMSIYQIRDDKFIIVYPNVNVDDVVALVNKTLELLKKPILVKKNNIYVKLKAVICNLKQEELNNTSLEELKRRIELAYNNIVDFQAKDVVIYEPAMEGVINTRMKMEEDLKLAIENNEFVQYLQPQYSLVTNKIVGFESLIRWNNPKYIKKSPQAFIELSEQKGYILDIARSIIDNTFSLAKKLENYDLTISLNLSPIQILQVGFVNDLKAKFDEYKLKPGTIALEITETFLMENFNLVNEKLKVLKKAGFKIHLDDFCTGYSSMAYLKDLPVDTIKIDYEFTKYVDTNKVNYSIVSCISTLAKELGLDVIVEGVETKSQQAVVKKLGCKIIQGFLIGKAMPYEEALKLLNEINGR